jgi:hypothetical protein
MSWSGAFSWVSLIKDFLCIFDQRRYMFRPHYQIKHAIRIATLRATILNHHEFYWPNRESVVVIFKYYMIVITLGEWWQLWNSSLCKFLFVAFDIHEPSLAESFLISIYSLIGPISVLPWTLQTKSHRNTQRREERKNKMSIIFFMKWHQVTK